MYIPSDFIHTDSTVTPRSSGEIPVLEEMQITVEFEVWPNPVIGHGVDIRLENADHMKTYTLVVYDAFGKMHTSIPIANGATTLPICEIPGVYVVCLLQDRARILTKRIVRI
jgi:hypothetical protein